jgi:hypothetical protein
MGCSQSSVLPPPTWEQYESLYPTTKEYYGAGCMWVSQTHILAGIHSYQSRSHKPKKISGFGGKANKGECWWQTAFRETIEEFFDVKKIPEALLLKLRSKLVPRTVLEQITPSYLTLVYTWNDLRVFLKICQSYLKQSTLYAQFPRTPEDLVFGRCFATQKSEISHIVFWPLHFTGSHFRFSSDLLDDLAKYNHNLANK